MRRAAKVDTTHRPIRDHLRAVGWSVVSLARLGDDVPDLLVARRGVTALIECKTGSRKLTAGQSEFHRSWPGIVIKATSGEDAETQLDIQEKCQFLRKAIHGVEAKD